MPAATGRVPRFVTVVVVVNLVCQVGIVVTGGLVRLTASGLGCPTWPECVPGSIVPLQEQELGVRPYIEFGNRLLTFVLALAAVATLALLLRYRRRLWGYGAAVLAGTAAQAVLGGVTVLTGLHPATVAAHFLVSGVLVTVSAVLLLRLHEADGPRRPLVPRALRVLVAGLLVVGAATLVLGTVVTGTGPHSGDAEVPVRFDLDYRTVSVLHAESVVLFVGLLLGLLAGLHAVGAPRRALARGHVLLAVTLAQGGIGWVQYALGLPRALVSLHMLGACLLVVALAVLVVSLRTREATGALPTPATDGAAGAGTGTSRPVDGPSREGELVGS